MTILRQSRRSFLKAAASAGGAAYLAAHFPRPVRAAPAAGPDLQGLRDKIDHIIVIYQENRSFDHYFGAYQPPGGGRVANLLDARRADRRPLYRAAEERRPAFPTAICRCPINFRALPTPCSRTGRFS